MSWWKNPKRTKFGKFLDKEGITQMDFADRSGVSRNTVWRLCNIKGYIPTPVVLRKVMRAVIKIDHRKDFHDFFDI